MSYKYLKIKVYFMNFEQLGIDEDFNGFLEEEGIKEANEVQQKVIPQIISGNSTLCLAQTGTGKTLAFALPISELIKREEDKNGPQSSKSTPIAVIIAPTKELSVQIHNVFKKISHHAKLRIRNLVGGQRNRATKSLNDQSYEVLIATPNKLLQSLKKKELSFSNLKYIVFDEADTLFDMGFKKDIEGIVKNVEYAQTDIHFFSATLPASVEEYLMEKFKKKELTKVGFKDNHKVQKKIDTYNIFASVKEKMNITLAFLQKTANGRGIIFANQKNQVDELAAFLDENFKNLKYKKLHGDMDQKSRLANHKSFVDGKSQVLIATDVAARGIDIKDLKWIFNWNLPKNAEFYLHRCGRVARAGRAGAVYNIVTGYDSRMIGFINEAIKEQSNFDLELIAKDIKDVKKKAKRPAKKQKTKRVKITKRSQR